MGPQQQGSPGTCGEERKALRPCPVPEGARALPTPQTTDASYNYVSTDYLSHYQSNQSADHRTLLARTHQGLLQQREAPPSLLEPTATQT